MNVCPIIDVPMLKGGDISKLQKAIEALGHWAQSVEIAVKVILALSDRISVRNSASVLAFASASWGRSDNLGRSAFTFAGAGGGGAG